MSTEVDRRKFLKYTGAAGAAAGALWVAPSVVGSSSAFATGSDCKDPQTLHWSDYASLGSAAWPDNNGTKTFTMQVAANGLNPAVWVRATVTAVPDNGQHPGKGSTTNGVGGIDEDDGNNGLAGLSSYYLINMANQTASGYQVTFDFFSDASLTLPLDVFNLRFSLNDIDLQNSGSSHYNDQVWVTSGFTVVNQGSQIAGSGTSSSPWYGTAPVTDSSATVVIQYPGPINSVFMDYRERQFIPGTNQLIQIGDLSWC